MAIYGIGAHFEEDTSKHFIDNGVVGVGWKKEEAIALYQMISSIKVGDIVYIKSFSPSSPYLFIKGVGIITDMEIIESKKAKSKGISFGRNVIWLIKEHIKLIKPEDKNNVRLNTLYEEFHPEVQSEIIKQITKINL